MRPVICFVKRQTTTYSDFLLGHSQYVDLFSHTRHRLHARYCLNLTGLATYRRGQFARCTLHPALAELRFRVQVPDDGKGQEGGFWPPPGAQVG